MRISNDGDSKLRIVAVLALSGSRHDGKAPIVGRPDEIRDAVFHIRDACYFTTGSTHDVNLRPFGLSLAGGEGDPLTIGRVTRMTLRRKILDQHVRLTAAVR